MIKGSIFQENTTISNGSFDRGSKCMRQNLIELQGEKDKFTIIVGDFNIPFSEIDKSSRQKINKDIVELNSTINQLDKIDICRPLHPTTEYTFFTISPGYSPR